MIDIRKLIRHRKTLYKSIISVNCPILNNTVYFTGSGFYHLLFKSNRNPRKISEQYMKLMCLPHVPEVIQNCTSVTETRPIQKKIKGKLKNGFQYELVYEVKTGVKIRVVVEKIGAGKYRFVSIMPHDRRSKMNLLKNKKHP